MINVNQPTEGGNFKRYTGITLMNVIGVNLTMAELNSIGLKTDAEPKYDSIGQDDGGNSIYKLRVEFVLGKTIGEGDAAENLYVRHSIFLAGAYDYNKDKSEVGVIDSFGVHRKFPIVEVQNGTFAYEYMDKASAEVAIEGESDLIRFIRAMASSKKTDVVNLKSLTTNQQNKMDIFTDYNYLKQVVNYVISINQAPVKVLLGIRKKEDKSYQEVFPFHFGRPFEDATHFFSRLKNLAKPESNWMQSHFYGQIDYNAAKASEEQFRLKIYEEEDQTAATASVSMPGVNTAMPTMPPMAGAPAPATAPAMGAPMPAAQPMAPQPVAPTMAPPMGGIPGLPAAMQAPQQSAQQASVEAALKAPTGPSVF